MLSKLLIGVAQFEATRNITVLCHRNSPWSIVPFLVKNSKSSQKTVYSSGSIEIDPIDVSNLRRFSSRHNRIGSNRTNVTKTSVRPGFEYTFFALTLCLEISDYAGDTSRTPAGVCGKAKWFNRTKRLLHSQIAEFRYLVAFTAGLLSSSPRNQCEHFRPFDGVYWCFSHSNSIMENK